MTNEQNKPTRTQQRFAGLFLVLLCLGVTIWTWYSAFFEGYFYLKVSLIAPAFLLIGLGLVLFPDYKTERMTRGEDISELSGLKLLTARWWVILVAGSAAGFANFALLYFLER